MAAARALRPREARKRPCEAVSPRGLKIPEMLPISDTKGAAAATSLAEVAAMTKMIWTASKLFNTTAELYLEMTISALRLVPGRR